MNLELFAFPKLITYYISVLKLKLMFYNISQIVLSQSFHFLKYFMECTDIEEL